MIRPGLVSISFRNLEPQAIVDLCVRGGLAAVEWGGDVHVPHGDVDTAYAVGEATVAAGLSVAAYGSYYRAGEVEDNPDFAAVLASAQALRAPVVRVWAGKRGSAAADAEYRVRVVQDLCRIAGLAASADVAVACEFHGGTLTDTHESALALYHEVDHANLLAYWQPPVGLPPESCRQGLAALLTRLSNLHVFHWVTEEGERRREPLASGRAVWEGYLALAHKAPGDRYALLEFVRDDSPEQLLADAKTLRAWLSHDGHAAAGKHPTESLPR